MASMIDNGLDGLVLVDERRGVTVIPKISELRRLNWFDGKLLRADDLRIEQEYVRGLVRRANRADGYGVVQGMTCTLAADGRLRVGPGLAIDPGGRSLLLGVDVPLDVQELIDRTAGTGVRKSPVPGRRDAFADCVEAAPAGQAPVGGARWYVVTVGWAEGLCGTEEVYGRLCGDACTTATDRPWRIDGLIFRAHPLVPRTALATSSAVALNDAHERSRLASALFADELADGGSLISGDGLRSPVWCAGAAPADPLRDEVPLAVLARAGGTTRFLDLWTVRRERMEPPPRRYWAGRLAMRPWDVFLAQVLQFQCQLTDLLAGGTPGGGGGDPCADRQRALEDVFSELETRIGGKDDERLQLLRKRVVGLRALSGLTPGARRLLIDGGIVELPPAGYLPVDPAGPPTVEEQVRDFMGAGVDLTFCATRHDALARAFEDAQHLDRISLLRGLDDPAAREQVEIIVPDAEVESVTALDGWQGVVTVRQQERSRLDSKPALLQRVAQAATTVAFELGGAGRVEYRDGFALRVGGEAAPLGDSTQSDAGKRSRPFGYAEIATERDPFSLRVDERMPVSGAADIVATSADGAGSIRISFQASFVVRSVEARPGGTLLRGVVDGIATARQTDIDGDVDTDSLTANQWPALLQSSRSADGGTVATLRVQPDERTIVILTLEWHGAADALELVVSAISSGSQLATSAAAPISRELGRLTLDREPGAATPGHPARVQAEDSLKTIQRTLGEAGYAEEMRRRIFPGADDGGVRLRATRDWVLFRRRAVLECGPVAPAAVATQTFAVFLALARGRTAARAGDYAYLGEVAFREGSEDAVRGLSAVVRAWDDAVESGTISAAGVVEGAPGGSDLGFRRLEELVDALASVTPRGPNYEAVEVKATDAPDDPRGADGMLLLAFAPQQELPTTDVAVVAVDRQLAPRYVAAMNAGVFDAAVNEVVEIPHLLGTVAFADGSGVPARPAEVDAVKRRYEQELGGAVPLLRVDCFTISGDDTVGTPAVRSQRADSVAAGMGGGGTPSVADVNEAVFDRFRSRGIEQRTVLVAVPAATVRVAVVAVDPAMAKTWHETVGATEGGAATLETAFAEDRRHILGTVQFLPDSAQLADEGELKAILEAYDARIGVQGVGRVDAISQRGDADAGNSALSTARATAVAEAFGVGGDGVKRLMLTAAALRPAVDAGVDKGRMIALVPKG